MEQKHETDLTPKEKRQLELKKIKSMTFKEKIEYFWMYYKIWLLFLVVGICVINIGITMYHNKNRNVLVGVALVDSTASEEIEDMKKEMKVWLKGNGDRDVVDIYPALSGDGDGVINNAVLQTWMAGKEIDVMLTPKSMYDAYHTQEFFMDMEEVLGESAEKYKEFVQGDAIVLENTEELKEMFHIVSDEVYIAVTVNGKHTENAKELVKCLLETFCF